MFKSLNDTRSTVAKRAADAPGPGRFGWRAKRKNSAPLIAANYHILSAIFTSGTKKRCAAGAWRLGSAHISSRWLGYGVGKAPNTQAHKFQGSFNHQAPKRTVGSLVTPFYAFLRFATGRTKRTEKADGPHWSALVRICPHFPVGRKADRSEISSKGFSSDQKDRRDRSDGRLEGIGLYFGGCGLTRFARLAN